VPCLCPASAGLVRPPFAGEGARLLRRSRGLPPPCPPASPARPGTRAHGCLRSGAPRRFGGLRLSPALVWARGLPLPPFASLLGSCGGFACFVLGRVSLGRVGVFCLVLCSWGLTCGCPSGVGVASACLFSPPPPFPFPLFPPPAGRGDLRCGLWCWGGVPAGYGGGGDANGSASARPVTIVGRTPAKRLHSQNERPASHARIQPRTGALPEPCSLAPPTSLFQWRRLGDVRSTGPQKTSHMAHFLNIS